MDEQGQEKTGRRRRKTTLLVLMAAWLGLIVAGLALTAVGRKPFAERFVAPVMIMAFGAAVLAGLWVNWCDVGWARISNWGGYCSKTHRAWVYLAGMVIGVLAGAAVFIFGLVLLVVRNV